MREILFKAKRIDNGEWVEGNLILNSKVDEDMKGIIIPYDDNGMYTVGRNDEDLGFEIWYKIDLTSICQYTGLTDKNGNKIWENDVVSCSGNLVVMWDERLASFCLGKKGWMYNHFFGEAVEGCDCEVIGNIFDNPELVKEGSE